MHAVIHSGAPDDDAIRREIDREVALVESAVRLVNSGAARRVTIGNLPFADAVVDRTYRLARRLHVRIRPILEGGEESHAVSVEPDLPSDV